MRINVEKCSEFYRHTLTALSVLDLTQDDDTADRLCRQLVSLTTKYTEPILGYMEWESDAMKRSRVEIEDVYEELHRLSQFIESNPGFFDAHTRKHLRDSSLSNVVYFRAKHHLRIRRIPLAAFRCRPLTADSPKGGDKHQ